MSKYTFLYTLTRDLTPKDMYDIQQSIVDELLLDLGYHKGYVGMDDMYYTKRIISIKARLLLNELYNEWKQWEAFMKIAGLDS